MGGTYIRDVNWVLYLEGVYFFRGGRAYIRGDVFTGFYGTRIRA